MIKIAAALVLAVGIFMAVLAIKRGSDLRRIDAQPMSATIPGRPAPPSPAVVEAEEFTARSVDAMIAELAVTNLESDKERELVADLAVKGDVRAIQPLIAHAITLQGDRVRIDRISWALLAIDEDASRAELESHASDPEYAAIIESFDRITKPGSKSGTAL